MKRYLEFVEGNWVYRTFNFKPKFKKEKGLIKIPEDATFATASVNSMGDKEDVSFRQDCMLLNNKEWKNTNVTKEKAEELGLNVIWTDTDVPTKSWDETEHLLSSESNKCRLLESVNRIKEKTTKRKSVVYKYPVPILESFTLDLPKGSQIVRVAHIDGFSWLWALTPVGEKEIHRYYFKGSKTGGEFEHENDLIFIGVHAIFVQMELALYAFLDKIEKIEEDGTLTPVPTPFNVVANSCWTS